MPVRDAITGRFNRSPEPVEQRFWAQVDRSGECWVWRGGTTGGLHGDDGYGAFYPDVRQVGAHVFAWCLVHGEVPPGKVLDHKCRNHLCVNAAHMEPVTLGDNVLRGVGLAAENARKECCIRGHALSGANLQLVSNYRNPDRPDWRQCRECKNWRKRERRAGR